MRRPRARLVAVCLAVAGLASCSSDAPSSASEDDVAAPDGSFCSLLVAFRESNDALAIEVNSGDAERAEAAVNRLVGQIDLLRERAPSDISADVEAVSVYVTTFDELFAEFQYDIDAFVSDEEAEDRFRDIASDQFDSSLRRLERYADTECAAGLDSLPA